MASMNTGCRKAYWVQAGEKWFKGGFVATVVTREDPLNRG